MKKILSLLLVSSWCFSPHILQSPFPAEGPGDPLWRASTPADHHRQDVDLSKIVPRITFREEQEHGGHLEGLSLHCHFPPVGDRQAFDSNWSPYPPEDIFPGAMSAPLNILSLHGYKGSSPDSYLKNKAQWQKMEAEVFVRMRGSAFYSLGTWPIAQKIDGWTETPAPATPAPEDALPAKTESAPEERPAS